MIYNAGVFLEIEKSLLWSRNSRQLYCSWSWRKFECSNCEEITCFLGWICSCAQKGVIYGHIWQPFSFVIPQRVFKIFFSFKVQMTSNFYGEIEFVKISGARALSRALRARNFWRTLQKVIIIYINEIFIICNINSIWH